MSRNIFILIIILLIIFYIFILPYIDSYYNNTMEKFFYNIAPVGSTSFSNLSNDYKIDMNLCSQDCCNFTQYKLPSELSNINPNYIGSNFSCNLGNGSGCVCMKKQNLDYLTNHGGNI